MNNLKLIDGKFEPQEAKEILLNMISSKIQFHTIKDFSTQIRIGEPEENSRKRIAELEEMRNYVISLTEQAAKDGLALEINSSITISCTEVKAEEVV